MSVEQPKLNRVMACRALAQYQVINLEVGRKALGRIQFSRVGLRRLIVRHVCEMGSDLLQ
jgi:hypothetical protein